jgi:RimJ/RimL family protein N-acetyltransferase
MGGVLFTDYNYASAQIHVAAFQPNWVNRQLLWATFSLPFNLMGVNKLIGLVPESNKAAIKFDISLGFVLETRVEDVFPDGAMLVFGMYKDQCRFLKMPVKLEIAKNGEVRTNT